MATFATAQQVYDTIGLFLDQLTKDPEIGPKFVAADTSFLVRYSDPECSMMMDATVDPPVQGVVEHALDLAGDLAGRADLDVVDLAQRRELGSRAGEEHLVG